MYVSRSRFTNTSDKISESPWFNIMIYFNYTFLFLLLTIRYLHTFTNPNEADQQNYDKIQIKTRLNKSVVLDFIIIIYHHWMMMRILKTIVVSSVFFIYIILCEQEHTPQKRACEQAYLFQVHWQPVLPYSQIFFIFRIKNIFFNIALVFR